LSPPARLPPGFDEKAAEVGMRFNGFYLFQLTGKEQLPAG
jgi:hypothetical protein